MLCHHPHLMWFGKRRATAFDYAMDIANGIMARDSRGLHDLIRLLLRPLQAELMVDAAVKPAHHARQEIEQSRFFAEGCATHHFRERDYPTLSQMAFPIRLATDVVLPCPWFRSHLVAALASHGVGRARGVWRQDHNHHLTLWLPWRIAFVTGGNHSITAGILAGEGELVPDEVYDLSGVFDRIRCDGRRYIDVNSGATIAKVANHRVAAVFEIGRMMRQVHTTQENMKPPD